jgi:type I restriction enzyme R subunit
LREKEGKNHFVVMDFRNVTRLFADPDWDGPIEIDEGFDPDSVSPSDSSGSIVYPPDSPVDTYKCVVGEDGCDVSITGKRVSIYDADGKLLTQESIVDYTRFNILGRYASLDKFIFNWTAEEKKEAIRGLLREQGIDLEWMKADQGMSDVDDFDFICHVAYDQKPLTRRERANNVKKRDFLSRYSGVAREVLEALLEKYMNAGIYEIEKTEILQLDPFRKFGKPSRIAGHFGGKEGYLKAVRELEQAIYEGVG